MNATPKMPLVMFINDVFLPERRRINDRPTSRSANYSCRKVLREITEAIGRRPLVSDLTDRTFESTIPSIVSPTNVRRFVDYFCAFWRCAHAHGLLKDLPPEPGEKWRVIEAELAKLRWTQEQIAIISTRTPQEAAALLGVSLQAVHYARTNLRMLNGCPKSYSRGRFTRAKPLSEEEGTLNHVMLTKYFPRNQRIRNVKTKTAYDKALRDFRDSLGHEPTLADLNDEAVEMMQVHMRDKELAPKTINERVGRVTALWNWLARKRLVEDFPAITPLPEPRRTPEAWTQEQLVQLFDACRREPGTLSGVPAGLWWVAIHLVLWDTGARIGELLALRWEWVNLETGFVKIPAESRKGGMQDAVYNLHPATLAKLREIQEPTRDHVFYWPKSEMNLYNHYSRILKRAGLPRGRKDKFHRMRKSVASHLQAAGMDASQSLGHSSPAVTRESYLDPTIVNGRKTHEVLFRPQGVKSPPAQATPQQVPRQNVPLAFIADADETAFL